MMIPDDLKRWQERHRYTGKRLAGDLGVHPMTVTYWRSGKVAIPKTVVLALKYLETLLPRYGCAEAGHGDRASYRGDDQPVTKTQDPLAIQRACLLDAVIHIEAAIKSLAHIADTQPGHELIGALSNRHEHTLAGMRDSLNGLISQNGMALESDNKN